MITLFLGGSWAFWREAFTSQIPYIPTVEPGHVHIMSDFIHRRKNLLLKLDQKCCKKVLLR